MRCVFFLIVWLVSTGNLSANPGFALKITPNAAARLGPVASAVIPEFASELVDLLAPHLEQLPDGLPLVARNIWRSADVAVYLDRRLLTAQQQAQLLSIRHLAPLAVQPGVYGLDSLTAALLRPALGGTLQALADLEACIISLQKRDEGIRLFVWAKFQRGSVSALTLAGLRLVAPDIRNIPADAGYFVSAALSPQVLSALLPWEFNVLAIQRGLSLTAPTWLGSQPIAWLSGGGVQEWFLERPNQFAEEIQKLYRLSLHFGTLQNIPILDGVVSGASAKSTANLNHVQLRWDYSRVARDAEPALRNAMRSAMRTIAGDKLSEWFGCRDKSLVRIQAETWPQAQAKAEAWTRSGGKIGESARFRYDRAQLAAKPTMLAMVEVEHAGRAAAAFFEAALAQIPGLPYTMPTLSGPRGPEVYAGISLEIGSDDLTLTAWLPTMALTRWRQMLYTGDD